jgi:hypothetical protein
VILEEFASKVDWEGGIFGALEYGLHESELEDTPENQKLIFAWRDLRERFDEMQEAITEVEDLLGI